MHHKKRTARLLLCVLALAMALSACGKKGGAFQGTVTQITGTQVTVTPDPVSYTHLDVYKRQSKRSGLRTAS